MILACSLTNPPCLRVLQHRAENPKNIHTAVLVKAAVFRSHDRIHKVRRNLVERYLLAVLDENLPELFSVSIVNNAGGLDRL